MSTPDGPLLVFGPASLRYDFGPSHPLTPRRFGPGIDLLRHVGAGPGLEPRPATDAQLLAVHAAEYLASVRRLSADPSGPGAMGVGLSDNPAFAGMHEASATVAGGSLAAMDEILAGRTQHAYHPGGGLHHAMAARAWGFCVYNDPALAIVRARATGLRVLYVDLDVHHGDGVQALTSSDPGTLTLSFHESGRHLFPETGFIDELGDGAAAGTSVNMPFEPYAGDAAWLPAVRALLPTLAAVHGPDVVVSQHGADAHAWDPLAHLRVTTTAMAEAARLVDAVAHRWAGGRWLATGGGGYDVYRVVPRAWALTWLAGAHREPPDSTPEAWRTRWEVEAGSFGTPGVPAAFLDAPNAGLEAGRPQLVGEERSLATLERVRVAVLPRLVREAEDRGWWRPGLAWAGRAVLDGPEPADAPTFARGEGSGADGGAAPVVRHLAAGDLDGLRLAARVISPFDPGDALALLRAASRDGARIVGAVAGDTIVGLAVAARVAARAEGDAAADAAGDSAADAAVESVLAVGVAPANRGAGLGRALLRALVEGRAPGTAMEARIGVAERDVVEPADVAVRLATARRLLAGAGFVVERPAPDAERDDPRVLVARLRPR